VQEWDGGYTVYSCQTRDGMKEDYNERYGNWGIHNAYDMLSDSRRHFEKMVVVPQSKPEKSDWDRMLDEAANRAKYQIKDHDRGEPER
jgi:hypothetical protein